MDYRIIDETVNKHRDDIVQLAANLIRIPTENLPPKGNETLGQAFFRESCEQLGLEIDEFRPDEIDGYESNGAFLKGRDYESRPNIVAAWPGRGKGRSILLSGHMDVAPKEPMPWNVCGPFSPVEKDGRLYGRGAADMKGGLAAAYMAIKVLKELKFEPHGSIILESVVDEEFASGNGTIASRLRGHNADFAVNLEASGLRICPACVGGLVYKVGIKGKAGMPYNGEEIYNPAYGIADLITALREYERERLRNINIPTLWDKSVQQCKVIIMKVKAGETQAHGQLSTPIDAWLEMVVQTYPGEKEEGYYERPD